MYLKEKNENYKNARNITIIGFFINLFLTGIKFFAGIVGDSRVMIADGLHSFSDIISDIAVFLGLVFSDKPEDKCHQYGHGKFETLSTVIVSIILIVVSYDIAKSAIVSIVSSQYNSPKSIALIVAFISIIIKELLYRVTIDIGNKINSNVIRVNAWHHRTDAFSSIAALIGIAGSMMGFRILDSIAAILVAILILKMAFTYGMEGIDELLEYAIPKDVQEKITGISKSIKGVRGIHKLRTRKVGKSYFADIHVLVDQEISVMQGHSIATEIENKLKKEIENELNVMIHIEPYEEN